MKLIMTVYYYLDKRNRNWKVWKESLPKKKGTYTQWHGHCIEADSETRADSKKEVLKTITKLENFK